MPGDQSEKCISFPRNPDGLLVPTCSVPPSFGPGFAASPMREKWQPKAGRDADQATCNGGRASCAPPNAGSKPNTRRKNQRRRTEALAKFARRFLGKKGPGETAPEVGDLQGADKLPGPFFEPHGRNVGFGAPEGKLAEALNAHGPPCPREGRPGRPSQFVRAFLSAKSS